LIDYCRQDVGKLCAYLNSNPNIPAIVSGHLDDTLQFIVDESGCGMKMMCRVRAMETAPRYQATVYLSSIALADSRGNHEATATQEAYRRALENLRTRTVNEILAPFMGKDNNLSVCNVYVCVCACMHV
jgi:hypothetical protein